VSEAIRFRFDFADLQPAAVELKVLDGGGPVLAGLRAVLIAGWSTNADSSSATGRIDLDAGAALQRLGLR